MAVKTTKDPSVPSPSSLVEIEQAVLGAIVLDAHETCGQQTAAEVARLGVDDFSDARHGTIFRAIIDLLAENRPPRLEDVTSRLIATNRIDAAGGVGYVTSLVHCAFGSAQFTFHASRLRTATARRFLEEAARLCLEAATAPEESFYASVSAALRVLETARDHGPAQGLTAMRLRRRRE